MKSKYVVVISIILGLLTAYLIFDYLNKFETTPDSAQYGEVVVTAVDVAGKTQLTNEMLQVIKMPVDYIHPLAVRSKNEAAGKITTTSLAQGEQILQKKLAAAGEVKFGLSYAVPVGKRAVTVAVDDVSGISGLIKPGDHVDVAAVINIPDQTGQKEIANSLVVLQNIEVLAVGKTLEDKSDGKTPLEYKEVTLAVTVEESRPLILANQKGNIRLMLRSPVDNSTSNTVPFQPTDYLW